MTTRLACALCVLAMTGCASRPVVAPCPQPTQVQGEPWMQPLELETSFLDAWLKIAKPSSSPSSNSPTPARSD